MNNNTQIKIAGLSKSFGNRSVLTGISIDIEAGDSQVILGGSGSGKTVLLKHLLGLLTPDSGSVLVNNVNVSTASYIDLISVRKEIGMCFQMAALFDSFNVFDNIAFGLRRHSLMNDNQISERVAECLSLVGLVGTEAMYPSELSGGMKRRVGFARAIAMKPSILLFDEPTTGLDPVMTDVITKVILNLKTELKATMITITHDLKVAFEVGDKVALLHRGKIIANQDPSSFKSNPNPLIQQFILGTSEGPFLNDPLSPPTGAASGHNSHLGDL